MDGVVLVLEEVGAAFVRELVLAAGGCLCHVFRVRVGNGGIRTRSGRHAVRWRGQKRVG